MRDLARLFYAAINIKNEGLRILSLGTSDPALRGNVSSKQFGHKSTTAAAVPDEWEAYTIPPGWCR